MSDIENDWKRSLAAGLKLSKEALEELDGMGIDAAGAKQRQVEGVDAVEDRPLIPKRAISAPDVLNEAYDYGLPSSFSRGMRVELPGATMLLLSGTASVDDGGRTVYEGDFSAQLLRTFRNLTRLLAAEGASWHDVVRTTCYLRDIERDYDTFNKVRTLFMNAFGLDPLPASTGIQARICRTDLLVEIEAIAIVPRGEAG
jgi:enamine deaminase RidA (YjgF/YER057c/UK114 family)